MEKKMREEIIIYGMLYITFLLWNYQISYIKDMRKMMGHIMSCVLYYFTLSKHTHIYITGFYGYYESYIIVKPK